LLNDDENGCRSVKEKSNTKRMHDHNPQLAKFAGERMAKIIDNKNNEAYLVMLAKQWGIEVPAEFRKVKPTQTNHPSGCLPKLPPA
jgi:hypothetical protein